MKSVVRTEAINVLHDRKTKLKDELSEYIAKGHLKSPELTKVISELLDTNHKLELLKL